MLINNELSVMNHCLLFPTVPLFVRFTFQTQLNQWKIKIHIKQYKAFFFFCGRFWKGSNLFLVRGSFIFSRVTTYLGSHFSQPGYFLQSWREWNLRSSAWVEINIELKGWAPLTKVKDLN